MCKGWSVEGEGATEEDAIAAAEANHEVRRRALLSLGEILPEDELVRRVADALRRHQAALMNGGTPDPTLVRWELLPTSVQATWEGIARTHLDPAQEQPVRGYDDHGAARV